ncbi:MAG TPA: aminotransferase class I/II-fold pyridoxal phosphate-dependent enzyme [Novosphingobium sp.]|jgi:aspartate/methionine/tyrosine aminotransferase|nr:aminotransferase class I/II-fold pyridoxal phosphate-dependent enzyme [Novosphingobium sp.]HPB21521.1 aminotransferase class I/II-fold pyridoxal phosphate-dependent enzyme [Novosphingobium sp.]HQD98341.1 aminotransferase class I/II-fold pyridoxal phosphate-dependent enzyme [Novosphingobium sp.]
MTAQIDPFHAIAISGLAHRLKAAGRSVIHMEFGQPSTGAPAPAIAEAHRVLDADPMGYWESPALKARIVKHYADWYGVEISPAQILLTCGASPALVLALSMSFDPGDRIALARPGYVAYRNNLKALHMEPVELPCGEAERFQLTAAALAALDPAPQGVIVASPANPTGTIIPQEELAAIAEVCRARGITIISDEIYHGISYGLRTPSILEVEPQALVVNSFSKYFSMAGWRLGWLVVPPSGIDAARARMGNLFLTPPSLAQHAGLVAMDCREELEANIATYARNRALLLDALPGMGLGRIAPPDAAFYIYADVSEFTDDSMEFCKQLLEATGVATAPGIDFDPVDGHRFVRFSFAVSTPEIEEAIRRIGPWLKERDRRPAAD